jgi:hypothetical protein
VVPAENDPPIHLNDAFFADFRLTALPQPPRACIVCERILPLESYRRTKDGIREMCIECEGQEPQRKQERQRQEQLKRGIHRMVAAARSGTVKPPALAEIAAEMVNTYGGIASFCAAWKNDIDLSKPGSKTRLDAYATIVKIAGMAAADRRNELDLTTVREEDLEDAITNYVIQVLGEATGMDTEESPGADAAG